MLGQVSPLLRYLFTIKKIQEQGYFSATHSIDTLSSQANVSQGESRDTVHLIMS
jgi:hypothetical protein